MTARNHLLDIYGIDLWFAGTRKDWREIHKALPWTSKRPESAGRTEFATLPDDTGNAAPTVALWVDVKTHRNPGELVDTCAHEAAHAAGRILDYIGHFDPCGEPHAYLTGWLTRWIWEGCQESS